MTRFFTLPWYAPRWYDGMHSTDRGAHMQLELFIIFYVLYDDCEIYV